MCDAPDCQQPLVALIRGVGLCERHMDYVSTCATVQRLDPTSLARPVLLALISEQLSAPQKLGRPLGQLPSHPGPPAGFYWIEDEGAWTIVRITAEGGCLRLGAGDAVPAEQVEFGRMVPVRPPAWRRPGSTPDPA